jgi:hypothetical protein
MKWNSFVITLSFLFFFSLLQMEEEGEEEREEEEAVARMLVWPKAGFRGNA